MQITTGTRWARTGNVSASRRTRVAETDPGKAARIEPVTPRGATGSKIHYAVKSHLAAPRGGVRGCVRGDVARRHGSERDAVGWHGEGGGALPRSRRPVPGPFGRSAPSSLLPSA